LLAREVLAGRIRLTNGPRRVEQWIRAGQTCLAKWFPELEVTPIAEPTVRR